MPEDMQWTMALNRKIKKCSMTDSAEIAIHPVISFAIVILTIYLRMHESIRVWKKPFKRFIRSD